MIKAGIIGGAGYTAGELIRILLYHPQVEITFVHSNSHQGHLISDVHTNLVGETYQAFEGAVDVSGLDVLFLCMGHGKSRELLEMMELPADLKVIDLSRDYRLKEERGDFVYGLPELNKSVIRQSHFIANPGCFATAIQLALLPLAKAGLLQNEIHVNAITGSTGAGQKPVPTTHFSWRNNNLSIYKAFNHQHLDEIRQSVTQLQKDFDKSINFLPHRGDFPRGIFASIYTKTDKSEKELKALYKDFYQDAPFTILANKNPNLKQVVNTNKCLLFVGKHEDKVLIISMIDNLLKGASGQAVQNMNLMFGLEETMGLWLKGVAF